ncbi:MAG: thioredoxin family protein [Anaeromyxobacteraceae bacterium]
MTTPALGLLVLGLFAAFVVASQVALRRRSRALVGTRPPALPGPSGARLAAAPRALAYFWSPSCGACRAITPRVKALAAANPGVVAVDVTRELELARALGVMATPTFVELEAGAIVGHHVGPVGDAVLGRYRPA